MKCAERGGEQGGNDAIRTILVDNSPNFVKAVEGWLPSLPRIRIIGHAFSGSEALERIPALKPDLVLMDISMPDINGLEVTRQLKAKDRCPEIVIVTLCEELCMRDAAAAAGADGYIMKSDIMLRLPEIIDELFSRGI